MFPPEFLPDPCLTIQQAEINQNNATIGLRLSSVKPQSACPKCHQVSVRIHSYYQRHVADLSCSGLSVEMTLKVRRFFCTNRECKQRIFTERLPGLVQPYGRRSERLNKVVGSLAIAMGVRSASRLLDILQMKASIWAILRVLHRLPIPCRPTPHILGVDDWAMRRGRRY